MTVLIKNGLVYDGRESPGVKKDILVSGERIARTGNFSKTQADEVIDATGSIVTPGFIDINTDSDHHLSIFSEPYQEDFLRQGVTTIIGGNCGVSLAPLFRGSLDLVSAWGDPSFLNIGWHKLGEFLGMLQKRGLGVNFGTLVGHLTLRNAMLGDDHRDLTDREIQALKKIFIETLKEGAFGISFNLGEAASKKIPYKEVEFFAKILRGTKKIMAVHIRNACEDFTSAMEEVFRLSEESLINLEISHLEPRRGFEKEYLEAKSMIEKASSTTHINFDVYPFSELALPIINFLPKWLVFKGFEDANRQIRLPYLRERLLQYFSKFNASDFLIGQAPKNLKFLEGKTFEDFSSSQNLEWPESFLKFMQLTHLKSILFYKDTDEETLKSFLTSSQAIISSNGASLPSSFLKHPRNCETFPKFLSLTQKENLMPFEKAVAKITSFPAQKYGIKKRGLIKEGYYADIVVLRDNRPSETMLNGKLVLKDGKPQKVLAGLMLRA